MPCASQNAINSNLPTDCCECVLDPLFIAELDPTDFHFFGSLWKQAKGNPFQHDGEMKTKGQWWIQMLSPYFFLVGTEHAGYCWNKCTSCSGSYVQKHTVWPLMLLVLDIFVSDGVTDVAH
jgi:hypothetical protein